MSLLNQHIAELQEKLQTLLKAYRHLELENQRLEKELTDLRQLRLCQRTGLNCPIHRWESCPITALLGGLSGLPPTR